MGDMDGGGEIGIEGLQVSKCKRIIQGGKARLRCDLGEIEKDGHCLGENALLSLQRRNAALWIDRQEFRRPRAARHRIHEMNFVVEFEFLQQNERGERAGSRGVEEGQQGCVSGGWSGRAIMRIKRWRTNEFR